MVLDSWLCARLARELDGGLAGARIQGVKAGRLGLRLSVYRRGDRLALRALLDPNGPMLAVTKHEEGEDADGAGGWAGGVAPLLRGATIDAIRAVPDERIIDLDVSSRSSFGVPARHRLTFELEPRKANILVMRPSDDAKRFIVLAALRQFKGVARSRSIIVGEPYQRPPLLTASLTPAEFAETVKQRGADEARTLARLLGKLDPRCTPPLARDVVQRCLAAEHDVEPLHECLMRTWLDILEQARIAADDRKHAVFVYHDGGAVAACHLVPLSWAVGTLERAQSLNEVCESAISRLEQERRAPSMAAIRERIATMLARCERETADLQVARTAAEAGDDLRRAGDAIYANLASIPAGAAEYRAPGGARVRLDPSLSAKQNAALYFKRYRKARSGLARITERLATLKTNREFYDQLFWELGRAEGLPLPERDSLVREIKGMVRPVWRDRRGGTGVAGPATGVAGPVWRDRRTPVPPQGGPTTKRSHHKAIPQQKSAAPNVALPGGAIAYVGRSPKDNERLTFSVASPDDWWFHTRNMPGAHVIVKPAMAHRSLTPDQIEAAARLAASHSRAADARTVEVDYTQRKHVRRQAKGRPGLVWYANFKTIAVKL